MKSCSRIRGPAAALLGLFASLSLVACSDDSADTAAYTDILINEVQSSATTGYLSSDFVELYNKSAYSYTFVGGEWYLTDSDGAASHVFYIPGGTSIAGGGFIVLLPDATAVPDGAPSSSIACVADGTNIAFGLGKSDAAYLYYTGSDNASASTAVDGTSWTAHVATRVRYPDGGDWDSADTHTPTPGAANE